MLDPTFYELTQDLQGALFQAGMALQSEGSLPPYPANPLLQVQQGYAESAGWLLVQAQEFSPEPLSATRFRVRAVWSSERIVNALLDLMTAAQWFDRQGDDYTLTEQGHSLIQTLTERRQQILAPLTAALPADDLQRLETLMRRILDASLSSKSPPGNRSLTHSRRRSPPDSEPVVNTLFQYCSDFNAFRDDCHMAAFQPLNIPAHAWEAFSLVWRGTANTPQTVFEQLPYRGYSISDYADGLQLAAQHGWLETDDNEHYHLTESGRTTREDAESLTDEYFYTPWNCLTTLEVEELQGRMRQLKTKLEGFKS